MKNKSVYRTMALQNIRKNRQLYVPYILTFVGMTAMYYLITSLHWNPTLYRLTRGGASVIEMLGFAEKIIAVFAVIFLFYTNSFLIKRRKKELGLYNILGMEKRHISRVLMWENLAVLLLGLVGGLFIGLLFDRLLFMILLRMMDFEIPLEFHFSLKALGDTVVLFAVIMALIHLNSIRQVHFANPVDLLRGGNVGEKEPKTKLVTAVTGFSLLGLGYAIALTTENLTHSLPNVFVAVLLVIIGTYMVFTAGSIALLKLLRKNKTYYYRSNHFISVSGMIYRMKQNAVGLANICILCSAVIVTVSFTVAMRMVIERAIRDDYPYDMITALCTDAYDEIDDEESDGKITISASDIQMLEDSVDEAMNALDLTMGNKAQFWALLFYCEVRNGHVHLDKLSHISMSSMAIVTWDGYHQTGGTEEIPDEGEILFYSTLDDSADSEITLLDTTYQIAKQLETMPKIAGGDYLSDDDVVMVVRDQAAFDRIHAAFVRRNQEMYETNGGHYNDFVFYDLYYKYFFNIAKGSKENRIAFEKNFVDIHTARQKQTEGRTCVFSYGGYDYNLYTAMGGASGLLFIGIFLGIIFMTAAVLIIYYKQLTEGHEDYERYRIMQQVGLTPQEIRASVNSQVLTVFFLPIVTACVHMCFAYPMMNRLLCWSMGLQEGVLEHTMLLCMLVCMAICFVVYTAVYFITSRFYYNIVTKRES